MAKATGLIFFNVASARELPFAILLCIQCICHGLNMAFLCVLFIFALHKKCQSTMVTTQLTNFLYNVFTMSTVTVADTLKEIDTCKKTYKEQVAQMGQAEREKQLKKIEDLFQKAKEYTDNKVQIAVQIYEMVS